MTDKEEWWEEKGIGQGESDEEKKDHQSNGWREGGREGEKQKVGEREFCEIPELLKNISS